MSYKIPLLILLPLIIIGVVVLSAKVFWGEDNPGLKSEVITPHKAWIVHTKGGGKLGINKQEILEDVTNKVSTKDGQIASIEGYLEKVDTIDKKELFLYFPAKMIKDGLDGYIVLSLYPYGTGLMSIDAVYIKKEEDRLKLIIEGTSKPEIKPWLYYSPKPQVIKRYSFRGSQLEKRTLLALIRFRNEHFSIFSLNFLNFGKKYFPIRPTLILEAERMDIVSRYLENLHKEFSIKEDVDNLWNVDRIDINKFEEIGNRVQTVRAGNEGEYNIRIFFKSTELDLIYGEHLRPDYSRTYILRKGDKYYQAFLSIRIFPQ